MLQLQVTQTSYNTLYLTPLCGQDAVCKHLRKSVTDSLLSADVWVFNTLPFYFFKTLIRGSFLLLSALN